MSLPSPARRLWGHPEVARLEALAARWYRLQWHHLNDVGTAPDVERMGQLIGGTTPRWELLREEIPTARAEALVTLLRNPPHQGPALLCRPQSQELSQATERETIWAVWEALVARIAQLQAAGPTALHPLVVMLWESPLVGLPRQQASGAPRAPDHQGRTEWGLTMPTGDRAADEDARHAAWLEALRSLTTPARNWIRAQGPADAWTVDAEQQLLALAAASVPIAHQILPALQDLTIPRIERLVRAQPALQPESLVVREPDVAFPDLSAPAPATAQLRLACARLEHAVRPGFDQARARSPHDETERLGASGWTEHGRPSTPHRPWGERLLVLTVADPGAHARTATAQAKLAAALRDDRADATAARPRTPEDLEALLASGDESLGQGLADTLWPTRRRRVIEGLCEGPVPTGEWTAAQQAALGHWLEPWSARWWPNEAAERGPKAVRPAPRVEASVGPDAPQTGRDAEGPVRARWSQIVSRLMPVLDHVASTWGRTQLLRLVIGGPPGTPPYSWPEAPDERAMLADPQLDPDLVWAYWRARRRQSLEAAADLAAILPTPWRDEEIQAAQDEIRARLALLATTRGGPIYQQRGTQREAATYLASPLLPLADVRAQMETGTWDGPATLEAIARHPEAIHDPLCRAHLQAQPWPYVWGLLVTGSPQQADVHQLVHQLVAAGRAGLDALGQIQRACPDRLREVLGPTGVRPLLSDPDAEVRLWAVRYMGQWQDAGAAAVVPRHAPPPARR